MGLLRFVTRWFINFFGITQPTAAAGTAGGLVYLRAAGVDCGGGCGGVWGVGTGVWAVAFQA
jgi:hypothetical protein